MQHLDAFDQDRCPVREDLLGEMYRASEHGLSELVNSVSADVRAMLALFCYRRSHLQGLARAIAASCEQRDLVQYGGRAGSVLFELARSGRAEALPTPASARKTITLSTKPLSSLPPLDCDEEVEGDDAPAAQAG